MAVERLPAAWSAPRGALEEIVEPYLLQQGFIGRTPRGRVLTLRAYKHLGLTGPARAAAPQIGLFDEAAEEGPPGKSGIGYPRASARLAIDMRIPPLAAVRTALLAT